MFRWLTERRRRKLLERPFPSEWRRVLERNVTAYSLLDAAKQKRLCELVQVLLAEKNWEGCGGFQFTDEAKVTIAGSACLLLLGRGHELFAKVQSILVYPSTVVAPAQEVGVFERVTAPLEGKMPVLGQAFRGGPVILAWDKVLSGARNPKDGHNVVLHEFAHKIDFLDGAGDGTPPLPDGATRRAWAKAFSSAFLAQQAAIKHGEQSFLDDYATKNEAEFFAVATESFFERPKKMAQKLPAVYEVMRDFYQLEFAH